MVAIPSRHQVIEQAKNTGHKVAAVLPIFYPRELLRAYGFQPIEVWGPPNISPHQQDHFQTYTCPIVRNATSFLLNGGLSETDLIFIPHTCDSLQGMGSVVNDFIKPDQAVLTLYHPRSHRASDIAFLVEELKRIENALQNLTGKKVPEEELLEAIQREEQADSLLALLYQERNSIDLTDREFYSVVRAREYLPAEEFTALVKALPKALYNPKGVGIALSGIISEPMSLFDHINQAGAYIAWDDLACGSRRLYQTELDGCPLEQIAKRLINTAAEPTKGISITERVQHILTNMERSNAKGLLVYDVKFCEPELFDLPHLKAALEAAKLPMLHVEHELNGKLDEQLLTRISAFIEVIQ